MSDDRTIHGYAPDPCYVIVRYDRSGRWYVENEREAVRYRVRVRDAAKLAALGIALLGRPGGARFDALVRAIRDTTGTTPSACSWTKGAKR